ncbi:hypothetical protein [Leucobacter ruminantium]|nr:hypothetical protein [Leucobacter ruminantium]
MMDCLQETTHPAPPTRPAAADQRSPKVRRAQRGLTGFGVVLLAAGAVLLTALLIAPNEVERTYGTIKTEVTKTVAGVREDVFGELPTVTLGRTGDVAELDSCDGTFTHMTSYDESRVPPVWAAHNGCQGDVLLPWEIGQHIRMTDSDQVYEVIDIRHTPQVWATIDDLEGLDGDLALQTCFYGEDKMKFVGLRPVEEG